MLLFLSRGSLLQRPLPKQHNKHYRRIYIPLAGFESAIPEIERLHNNTLDSRSTGISTM